jgi:hypothetical protein
LFIVEFPKFELFMVELPVVKLSIGKIGSVERIAVLKNNE